MSPPRQTNESIASRISGLRTHIAAPLHDPDGRSAYEKPPTNTIACDFLIFSAQARSFSIKAAGDHSVKTVKSSTSNPSRISACRVSYSEFVPGKTGIMTRGLPVITLTDSLVVLRISVGV